MFAPPQITCASSDQKAHSQAYLRLANAEVSAVDCSNSGSSPTGRTFSIHRRAPFSACNTLSPLNLPRLESALQNAELEDGSTTGQLPAVEAEGAVLASSTGSESDAARSLFAELARRGADLDAKLDAQQRAQIIAFSALVERCLEPATLYTTWCESESFSKHTRVRLRSPSYASRADLNIPF